MIVVGVDGSEQARAAVEWAADDAFRMREPLRIVHAVDRWPYDISKFPVTSDPLLDGGRKVLAEAEAVARSRQPGVEVSTEQLEGGPGRTLREQDKDASEIVVGTRGLGGFAAAMLGSVSLFVAGHAECPVVVVRDRQEPVTGRVVVGVDDSPSSDAALAYAFDQAVRRGATLVAVHAWQLPVHAYAPGIPYDMDEIRKEQHQTIVNRLAVYSARYPELKVVHELPTSHPVDALVSQPADLLVVGSHGRGSVGAALLGSVSHGVLHHARCTVAVVRGR
ncbi:MAG: universal stress protein [Nonomuraea sp.]|nr:universal stress protein [Nonomuraea sp.]